MRNYRRRFLEGLGSLGALGFLSSTSASAVQSDGEDNTEPEEVTFRTIVLDSEGLPIEGVEVEIDGTTKTNPGPVIARYDVEVTDAGGDQSTMTCRFDASESSVYGSAVDSYTWAARLKNSGDDPTIHTGEVLEGQFQLDKTYEIQLWVTDERGHSDTVADMEFKPGDECFITTAVAGEVRTLNSLRRFRDESMASTPIGRAMTSIYYRVSPPIADTMRRNPDRKFVDAARKIVRRCASISDAQARTDSRVRSSLMGTVLTCLYIVGILLASAGHTWVRAGEMLRN